MVRNPKPFWFLFLVYDWKLVGCPGHQGNEISQWCALGWVYFYPVYWDLINSFQYGNSYLSVLGNLEFIDDFLSSASLFLELLFSYSIPRPGSLPVTTSPHLPKHISGLVPSACCPENPVLTPLTPIFVFSFNLPALVCYHVLKAQDPFLISESSLSSTLFLFYILVWICSGTIEDTHDSVCVFFLWNCFFAAFVYSKFLFSLCISLFSCFRLLWDIWQSLAVYWCLNSGLKSQLEALDLGEGVFRVI